MTSLWLIIWRFQPLHRGHIQLISRSLEENPATLVLIGSVNKEDEINPYSFEERKDFILWEFLESKISIAPLPDFPDDQDWIEHILLHIPERVTSINLYCGDKENDYAVHVLEKFAKTIPFHLYIQEINRKILPISGTQIRDNIRKNETEILKKSLWAETFKKLEEM